MSPPQNEDKRITDVVERATLAWIDQYNQMLILTAQALQRLHLAFDGKFTRGP
jgi:hypothetical protein